MPRIPSAWLTKVPMITATFWVIKVLSTTIGETFADFLAVNVGLGPLVTDAIMISVLAAALTVQLRTRRYTPWIYWSCVVLVSIVGTQVTDFLTDTLGVSLYVSTAIFSVVLITVFAIWHRQEGTLAIASINTPRREAFYWGAILVTFALGTAAGDLATEALSLGFRTGTIVFAGLLLLTFVAYKAKVNPVLTFWIAYILTRPLGASLGDLLTQDVAFGGLGLGAELTSVIFFVVILVLVVREQILVQRHGVQEKGAATVPGRRHDLHWSIGSALAVVVLAGCIALTETGASTAASAPAGTSSTTGTVRTVKPTTALGDVSSFVPIVTDLQAQVTANDFTAALRRAKDLEVAWDSGEAGLKPRDAADWHTLDGQIDAVLTSVRATAPVATECAANLKTLHATLDQFNGTA